jgi:predicted XRE-type DNA-binding protein
MAKRRTGAMPIESGSGNVFADLGLPDAEEHFLKAQLVSRIQLIIQGRRLTQRKAADLLGLSQPDVSRLLRGQFRDYSLERLLRLLMALDRDIEIVIRPKPASSRRPSRLQVVAA